MVENKISSNLDLNKVIILAPLAVVTVFCLSFVQMKAMNTQNSMKQEAVSSKLSDDSKALPLVTQPTLPKLETAIDVETPAPVSSPANSYTGNDQKSGMVGPSSKNSGNALQPNSSNLNNSTNNELQATRKAIRLEDAKL